MSDIFLNNSSLNPLNTQNSEPQYFPISIIITSYYSNIEFYRKLLIEFYKIIKFEFFSNMNNDMSNFSNNLDIHKINSFQKLELLNYFHFCEELLRPPNKSIFNINMRFNSLELKFNSLQEMPNNDFCIELLFNTLEISVIIKLFTALLFEKHIIIISNQNLPLFCIGESLKLLLFPLKWPHIYIPNLPYDQIKFLESPTPYLMGINSPLINIQDLINEFPSNIICDVNTSTLYGNLSNLNLPKKEEIRIKSKLLKLKSKFKNNYDEIDFSLLNNSFNSSRKTNSRDTSNSNSNSNSEGNEEFDNQLTFAQNVQNIFFDLFRNNLANFKNEYISGNIFNSQKFLNSFKDSDYKFFFEKLINTLVFEDFILSMQFYDDSPSRQYNNICNLNEKKQKFMDKKNKYYIYEFKTKKTIENNVYKNEKINFVKAYNEVSDIIENCKKNNNNINTDLNENKFTRIRKFHSFKQQKGDFLKSEILRTTIRTIKEKDYQKCFILNFYGKNGFISFYKNHNKFFLYHNLIYKEINQIYEEITCSYACNSEYKMVSINASPSQQNKESEEKEKDEEKITDIPINFSSQLFIVIGLYLIHNIEYEQKYNDINQTNSNKNNNNNSKTKNNINVNSNANTNINNISNENNNSNGKNEDKNLNINDEISNKVIINKKSINNNISIIKLFINAFKKNQYEFPRNIFFIILSDFSLEELKQIQKTNIKYIDKTIQYKIDKIEKITYKSMVINVDSDIDDINDDDQTNRPMNHHKNSDDFDDIKLLSFLDKNISNNNNKNDISFTIKENEMIKNGEGQNFKKTKVNVIDNSSFISNGPKSLHENKKNKINFNSIHNNGNCCSTLLLNQRQSKNNFDIHNINIFSDPMALSEKICLILYTFLCKVKIENYNVKNYDINFFRDMAYSDEFEEVKSLIISLKNISIETLSQNPKNYYCFWLNMYNFLTIFSIIFKCEIISNFYEWFRFLKNSYFEIGNLVISLYEMETYILRGKETSKRIYTNVIDNTQFKIKPVERIENSNLINFGISLPTISAPIIRIYYPFNFIDSLKINKIEFFSRNINYNTQNQNIEIPEYALWIDPNFNKNLNNYKNFLPKGIFNFFLNQNMNIGLIKYDWKLTFVNFKNLESDN